MIKKRLLIALASMLTLIITSCSQEPRPVHAGEDECVHCRMIITDIRFAAQAVTEKGKSYKFDAIECLVAYLIQHPDIEKESIQWVSNYEEPGSWLDRNEAQMIQHWEIRSPMGLSLIAVESENLEMFGQGEVYSWKELKELVATSWNLEAKNPEQP